MYVQKKGLRSLPTQAPTHRQSSLQLTTFVLRHCINYSDGTTYESTVNITPEQIAARFDQEIPSTSLPRRKRFILSLMT